jgi:hypothetical protein
MSTPHQLYAALDPDGSIYAASETPFADDESPVILFPNPTWHPDDFTDDDGNHWIRADRLGKLFSELTAGLPVTTAATACRIGPPKFRDMQHGIRPIPEEIWQRAEKFSRKFNEEIDFPAALQKSGLTDAAAARKFNVHPNTIRNWKKKKTGFPPEVKFWTRRTLQKPE